MSRLTTLLSAFALATVAMAPVAKADPAPSSSASRRSRRRAARGWRCSTRRPSEIKDKTAGRVTMKYFEGGQQGDERDFVRKIKLGQLDGAAVTAIGLAMIDESIRVLELPMMFKSAEELDYVADKMWPYFQKKFEAKGFRLNDRGEVGWIYFLSKNKVESLDDLKGQKLWMWGDDQLVGAHVQEARPQRRAARRARGRCRPDLRQDQRVLRLARRGGRAAVVLEGQVHDVDADELRDRRDRDLDRVDQEDLAPTDQKIVEEIGKANAKKLRKVIRKANEDAQATMTRKGITVVNTPVDDGRRVHEGRRRKPGTSSSARSTRRKSSTWCSSTATSTARSTAVTGEP